MIRRFLLYFCILPAVTASPVALSLEGDPKADGATPAAVAFEKLAALEGNWVDVDGTLDPAGEVAASYRVTSNGTAVIETIFPGKPYEMVTVFYRDGGELALTHYCSLGNQPQMRSVDIQPDEVTFSLSGGTGFDPAHDRYMHSRHMHLVPQGGELQGEWRERVNGVVAPELHKKYRLRRAAE